MGPDYLHAADMSIISAGVNKKLQARYAKDMSWFTIGFRKRSTTIGLPELLMSL